MARKTIVDTAYTQINTSTATFLAQNLSNQNILIVINPTLPALSTPHDFVLKEFDAISGNDVTGIVWAKVEVGAPDAQMSIVE